MRLTLQDGSSIPSGFFGNNSMEINRAINSLSAIAYLTALRKYYHTLLNMVEVFQPKDHRHLISGVIQSWTKGYGLLELAGLKRPVALHILQVARQLENMPEQTTI